MTEYKNLLLYFSMTLKKAIQALASLGFKMEAKSGCVKGTIESEPFDFSPHAILSHPIRDVYIGQTCKGWHISSHINFKAKRWRENIPFTATILNIRGEGSTLEEAMKSFHLNFDTKSYDGTEANERTVQPLENRMGVLPPSWLR